MFEVGDKVFYYGANQEYYGGIYKITGRLSKSIWKLKGRKYDFFAEEKELQKVQVSVQDTTAEQLSFHFEDERYLDDLM